MQTTYSLTHQFSCYVSWTHCAYMWLIPAPDLNLVSLFTRNSLLLFCLSITLMAGGINNSVLCGICHWATYPLYTFECAWQFVKTVWVTHNAEKMSLLNKWCLDTNNQSCIQNAIKWIRQWPMPLTVGNNLYENSNYIYGMPFCELLCYIITKRLYA